MKIAATQFNLQKVSTEEQFWDRLIKIISESQAQGAHIVVFPEYFSLSLLMCQKNGMSFNQALAQSQDHSEKLLQRAQEISNQYQMAMVLGTVPWMEKGRLTNRSHFVQPHGAIISQDKIFMTRFEDEEWKIQSGDRTVKIFEFQGRKCAILTCYDSEFASASLPLAEAGVELLFVPSCTDNLHGYWRVRHCCEARTIENQLFVVMSCIVGGDPAHEAIDHHAGRGGVFSPCDIGFPADGILALGEEGQEGIAIADLDFEKLSEIRRNGTVLNLRDSKNPKTVVPQRV